MKKYIKSDSEEIREYYAYPIKNIKRLIQDYLYWEYDLGEDVVVTEPAFYAFIANSDMTDIDVAFVSKDENKVSGLSQDSEDVRLLLDGEYREETYGEDDVDFNEIDDRFSDKGITVLDDESGSLDHLGASVLFNDKIEILIDEIIQTTETKDASVIYDNLMKLYGDRVIDDLYVSDEFQNMIIPVKKEHWRF